MMANSNFTRLPSSYVITNTSPEPEANVSARSNVSSASNAINSASSRRGSNPISAVAVAPNAIRTANANVNNSYTNATISQLRNAPQAPTSPIVVQASSAVNAPLYSH